MTFLKVNCLASNPNRKDGTKIEEKTSLVLVNLNSINAVKEDKGEHCHKGKNLAIMQLKDGSSICVVGSVKEIADKIEVDKSRFVVDLTALKSE